MQTRFSHGLFTTRKEAFISQINYSFVTAHMELAECCFLPSVTQSAPMGTHPGRALLLFCYEDDCCISSCNHNW